MTKPKPARGESGAHVWVVEVFGRKLWRPCAGDPWRPLAKQLLTEYIQNNPDDKFRLAKYIRQSSKPRGKQP